MHRSRRPWRRYCSKSKPRLPPATLPHDEGTQTSVACALSIANRVSATENPTASNLVETGVPKETSFLFRVRQALPGSTRRAAAEILSAIFPASLRAIPRRNWQHLPMFRRRPFRVSSSGWVTQTTKRPAGTPAPRSRPDRGCFCQPRQMPPRPNRSKHISHKRSPTSTRPFSQSTIHKSMLLQTQC